MTYVGNVIYKKRKDRQITQQQLANMIPIGREAVSKWERGITIPDIYSLIRLSKIFEITINELLEEEKEEIDKAQKRN